MASVTRLERSRPGFVRLELDGAAWRELPIDAVVRAGVAEGVDLSRERLRTLARERRRSAGRAVAVRALSYRDRSSAELEQRLDRARVPLAVRRDVVAGLAAAGYVDDERYARGRARALAARAGGNTLIRDDLLRRGLDPALVERIVGDLAPERERAERVIAARGSGPATARFLARKGFGEDAVEAAQEEGVAPDT